MYVQVQEEEKQQVLRRKTKTIIWIGGGLFLLSGFLFFQRVLAILVVTLLIALSLFLCLRMLVLSRQHHEQMRLQQGSVLD